MTAGRSIMTLFTIVNYLLLLSGASVDASCRIKPDNKAVDLPPDLCTSKVYCNGDLLKTVQLADLYNEHVDSKTFVDKHQKYEENVTLANFNELMRRTNNSPSQAEVHRFVEENFDSVTELINATLDDWKESVPLERRIVDPVYKKWVSALNHKWKDLARRMDDDVEKNPNRHSLMYVPNAFIIPGGRFKEFYYWDTYWIIEGLLLCDMPRTTKGVIDNLLGVVKKYGFIPNGGRVYYLMRSQPPFLISMVEKYLEYTNDKEYLFNNLDLLEKEFQYFQRYKSVKVIVRVGNCDKEYTMYRYIVNSDGPRPESYREDYNASLKVGNDEDRRMLFNNIKAGAETGWDFSARWFLAKNGSFSYEFLDITTQDIIPVDLNSLVEKNARTLSNWFGMFGDYEKQEYYEKISTKLQEAIRNVLWNKKHNMWFDYNIKLKKHKTDFYSSNLMPLYTNSYKPKKAAFYGQKSVDYIQATKINEFLGGIPSSLNYSRQQWDFPNAWAPLQSMIVQGLRQTGYEPAMELAKEMAGTWLRSNYIAYNNTHLMYEKYNATQAGKEGGDGEYKVQDGFGWTNGVVLEFLDTYRDITFDQVTTRISEPNTNIIDKIMMRDRHQPVRPVLRSTWSHYFGSG